MNFMYKLKEEESQKESIKKITARNIFTNILLNFQLFSLQLERRLNFSIWFPLFSVSEVLEIELQALPPVKLFFRSRWEQKVRRKQLAKKTQKNPNPPTPQFLKTFSNSIKSWVHLSIWKIFLTQLLFPAVIPIIWKKCDFMTPSKSIWSLVHFMIHPKLPSLQFHFLSL